MKAIHGGKSKNDRIDAAKIAGLLRAEFISRKGAKDAKGEKE